MRIIVNGERQFEVVGNPTVSDGLLKFELLPDDIGPIPEVFKGIIQLVEDINWGVSAEASGAPKEVFELMHFNTDEYARSYVEGNILYMTNSPAPILHVPTPQEIQAAFEEAKRSKKRELSERCKSTIFAGDTLTLPSKEVGTFSFNDEDQINLKQISDLCKSGAVTQYPYHANGKLCKMYSAQDLLHLAMHLTGLKVYNTTYCNYMYEVVNRCTTSEEAHKVAWGQTLPKDLKVTFDALIKEAGGK